MSTSSPCIKLCVFDQGSGLCQGCGRTLAEIGAWSALAEAERLAIMAALPGRLAQSRETRRAVSRRPASRRTMTQI